MTWEARDASYVRFERYFASRIRLLLREDSPRIPQPLLELIKRKDYAKGLLVSHTWRDIIQYNVSMVIRVYGFLGKTSCSTPPCALQDKDNTILVANQNY